MNIKLIKFGNDDFSKSLKHSLAFNEDDNSEIQAVVNRIIKDIKNNGDSALLSYTKKFEHLESKSLSELELTKESLKEAYESLDHSTQTALNESAQRIRDYHQNQIQNSWDYVEDDGTRLGQKITAIDSVGLYVPGGKAAYPSSVLMNAIPAKIAGVKNLIMVVPTPSGEQNDLVLAAEMLADVDRVFSIGGAQAIASLAFGTKTIPKVDKIVGPGNAYVAEAKRLVFGTVGIDMIAGPSEITIICDGKTNPDWIAMDLFSQAEHDELSQSILICPDKNFINLVKKSMIN